MLFAPLSSQTVSGIEIQGGAAFIDRTKESLDMLGPLPEFAIVRENISVIRQGKRSGMKAWASKPTFVVGKPTWKHSALWFAGAIVHDAYHAKLYLDARKNRGGTEPEADDWTGTTAEKKCLAVQRQILSALNADQALIEYVERCALNPTYQGRNQGWKSWLDYLKRWW